MYSFIDVESDDGERKGLWNRGSQFNHDMLFTPNIDSVNYLFTVYLPTKWQQMNW